MSRIGRVNPEFRWPPVNRTQMLLVLLTLGLLFIFVGGCGSGRVRLKELPMAPLAEMPDYVQSAPREVQEAYRFAVANPELLKEIPCYCGCNTLGHTSNLDCYVDSLGNVIAFENHAAY